MNTKLSRMMASVFEIGFAKLIQLFTQSKERFSSAPVLIPFSEDAS